MPAAIRKIRVAAALLLMLPQPACVAAQQADTVSAAGVYDGSQTEMAAGLELSADGRYRYGLSYGAVDEVSQGKRTSAEGGIVLNSDPSTPPQFELLDIEENSGSAGTLTLSLDGAGLPLPLFSAVVEHADGTVSMLDFSEHGLEIQIPSSEGAVSVRLLLPIYEIQGEQSTISSPGEARLRFAFHPNDLGFKAFDNTFMPEKDGALFLERYGRTISFRKITD